MTPVQGGATSEPPVISWQHPKGGVCTLRVQEQAKQVAHTGPPLALAVPLGDHLATHDPTAENNQGTPAGHMHLKQAYL
jgi:hypothetical protein